MSLAPLPPTAANWPVLGNLPAFLRDPLRFLCDTRDRYGDVVQVTLGPAKVTLISHPDLVEEVLVTHNRSWRKDAYLQTTLVPVLGQGLLASEGDFWRRQRRLAQPAFHRDRITAYGDIMVAEASALAQRWQDGASRDVHADMMKLTLEIVAKTLFGTVLREQATQVGEALDTVLTVVADPVRLVFPFLKRAPTPSTRRLQTAIDTLSSIVYGFIHARRAGDSAGEGDLLSMLLEAVDEDGSRMSDQQLRDECMTLFLAGHETTALVLSWTWYLLSRYPSVDRKLEAELAEVLGGRTPTVADLPRLKYTANIINESMRLYPPAWSMGREAVEDVVLGGYLIRKDHQVWFPPWSIHRDPRWFDRPNELVPERWEGELQKKLHRYAYFPFGGGPRYCIGQAFAQMESVLILATLAQRFRVQLQPRPLVQAMTSVTLRPKPSVRGVLQRRATS